MARRALLTVVLLALAVPAAWATAGQRVLGVDETSDTAQLDGDAERETVRAVRVDRFRERVVVEDSCGREARRFRVNRVHEALAADRLPSPDRTRNRPLLFVIGSSGASGRLSDTHIVRFDRARCGRLRTVFRFPSREYGPPAPGGALSNGSFSVQPKSLRPGGGYELRATVGLYGENDAGCCPTALAVYDYRWDARSGRYERYRSFRRRP